MIKDLPLTILDVVGEAVAIPAGAAGEVVQFQLANTKILSAANSDFGDYQDSSLSFDTGTTFTTEVESHTPDDQLSNGEYWVNYESGLVRGKKANAGVADTVDYRTATLGTSSTTLNETVPASEDTGLEVKFVSQRALASPEGAVDVFRSTALQASQLVKASAGRLMSASLRIDSTAASGTYYIQFLDASSVPADGAVTTLVAPTKVVHVTGTDSELSFEFGLNGSGIPAADGIVAVLSTTEFTKTVVGSNIASMTVEFK